MVEFSARRISMAPAEIQPNKIGRKGERKKSDEEGEGNEKVKEGREERRKGKMQWVVTENRDNTSPVTKQNVVHVISWGEQQCTHNT